MIIRFFDIIFSITLLIVLFPFLIVIAILVGISSQGGILFKQTRVGKNNIDFILLKFRTMYSDSDRSGLLTVGTNDSRITTIGKFLRKYKLDELPQIFNILVGDMSFVGPRPEVRKYVNQYNENQKQILNVSPGLTDFASLKYFNENELLAKADSPEEFYINTIMPEKIELNLVYIRNRSIFLYFRILFLTFSKIFS